MNIFKKILLISILIVVSLVLYYAFGNSLVLYQGF